MGLRFADRLHKNPSDQYGFLLQVFKSYQLFSLSPLTAIFLKAGEVGDTVEDHPIKLYDSSIVVVLNII